ncbi:MAG: NAD-dependent succinate-semialdehyde dehydrogenase [Rhodospirillales bacterium]|nr:NAD-dependent succinate-semialdehyde dehydrogenase [Rhodospirillales bacterium]
MYINGTWTAATADASFDVFNPADGSVIGQVYDGGQQSARAAIDAAAAAFRTWSKITAYERSAILYRAYQLMIERKEDLAQTMTMEQGKPLRAARMEVQYGADFLLWFAEEAKRVYGETIPSARADQRFIVAHQPIGVVAAITPWNYPVSMITRKVGPALAAGCTVVLKPAEATPLCAIKVFECLIDAGVPEGVINLVTGQNPAPIGEEFVNNPKVRKLTFTGSTAVGKMLAGQAAGNMKRVSCELGGHAPFLVFEDADPVHAAKGAQLIKFLNTGQACISPNRMFVHISIADQFIDVLQQRVSKLRAGSGLEDGVAIGPLVNEAAVNKVAAQVDDAIARGATLHSGGKRLIEGGLDKGFFYAPTVLSGITEDMLIYREETFGPVAAVMTFDDDAKALEMANDTTYGLAAYVYTRDIGRAMRMFEGLDFGIIGINDINPTSAAAPFGGMKDSGLGREGAREGIMEYLETKMGGFSI